MTTSYIAHNTHGFANAARAVAEHIAAYVRPHIAHLRQSLAQSAEERERERDEAYLAESVDRYDLEHRMRALERARVSQQPHWLTGYSH